MKIRKIQKSLGQLFDEQGLEVVIDGENTYIGSATTGYCYTSSDGIESFITFVTKQGKEHGYTGYGEYKIPKANKANYMGRVTPFVFPKGAVFSEEELKQLREAAK